jgi:hypothetical protein
MRRSECELGTIPAPATRQRKHGKLPKVKEMKDFFLQRHELVGIFDRDNTHRKLFVCLEQWYQLRPHLGRRKDSRFRAPSDLKIHTGG